MSRFTIGKVVLISILYVEELRGLDEISRLFFTR